MLLNPMSFGTFSLLESALRGGVSQRARGSEQLAGLEPGLESGHRPSGGADLARDHPASHIGAIASGEFV